ncbi:ATP-dependent 6-phosphofructokinase [Synechococcus sp. AH-551-G15]|nr:ATP-dependent 6-phosphofructokinase [Synechococcus sp. AH-551-G15]
MYEKVLNNPDNYDFKIQQVGEATHPNPSSQEVFVSDDERIAFSSQIKNLKNQFQNYDEVPSFEKAGARKTIFHDNKKAKAALITCGGLCPGLNNVIKGLVNILEKNYGVQDIVGIRYGYKGLTKQSDEEPLRLNSAVVDQIHKQGGTILGSSRGNQDPKLMVDELQKRGINLLFCIGGDGTLKGAEAIANEANNRNAKISVVGVPKTIDNDLGFVEKTFGFETSVQIAAEIISCAHNEAEGAENGIGIVKLMGRDSGFIAATASLANSVVDFCLIPELPFQIDGPDGLCMAIEDRLKLQKHAVVVVAEGAGQELFDNQEKHIDQSGNILKDDIGELLKTNLSDYFKKKDIAISIKYLDPSYHIRSVAANASDAVFCHLLAEYAVHAAMAGKTNLAIGYWNNFFTHVPIALATEERRMVSLEGALWRGVISATQQEKREHH